MSKEKIYDAEMTQGENPKGKESFGVTIWLDTMNKKKSKKMLKELIEKLNSLEVSADNN